MKNLFSCISLSFLCVLSAQAKLIPHYGMDSLVVMSDIVVYCGEMDNQYKEDTFTNTTEIRNTIKWTETRAITKCKVLQSFKGDLAPGSEVTVNYNSIFKRYLSSNEPYDEEDASGKIISERKAEYLPLGKALLFLRKNGSVYQVVDARLVQDGKVYQFTQVMNPGPLELDEQKQPENFQLLKNGAYGEQELLKDMAIALKKAALLKKPVPMNMNMNMW